MNTIQIITSWRFPSKHPGRTCYQEHREAQTEAFESWANVGADVHVLTRPNRGLYWDEIALTCRNLCTSTAGAWWVDGDIILTEPFAKVAVFLDKGITEDGGGGSYISEHRFATSHRYCFKRNATHHSGVVEAPYGLSIFYGNWEFWNDLAMAMRASNFDKFGVGDDQFVVAFANAYTARYPRGKAYDFTDCKCVFHREHGGRFVDRDKLNDISSIVGDPYVHIPKAKITLEDL